MCVVQNVYLKGASLMRMLQGVLGADVFQAGIQAYLAAYQYKTADSTGLFVILTDAARKAGQSIDVVEFMNEWTQQPGYPIVNCTTASSPLGIGWTCTQRRYYYYPQQSPPSSSTWTIYLTAANNFAPFTSANGLRWPATQSVYSFPVPSSTPYIKLNQNSTGFYRVMYDRYGWQQLSGALNVDGFSGMHHDDRLGLVLDAYEFIGQGWVSVSELLNLTRFLQYDTAVSHIPHMILSTSCQCSQPITPYSLLRAAFVVLLAVSSGVCGMLQARISARSITS